MAHRLVLVTELARKPLCTQSVRFSSYFQPSESEYNETAIYPPILDLSREAIKDRQAETEALKITSLPTVEEKLIELNMPKYYGWWACRMYEGVIPYNPLPFTQFATRTCVTQGLPSTYSDLDGAASPLVQNVKSKISDLLLQELDYVNFRQRETWEPVSETEKEDYITRQLIPVLNRALCSTLSADHEHISSLEVDIAPRVEASWFLGGIEPDRILRKTRENNKIDQNKNPGAPINRPMQYYGKPVLTLRGSMPLPQILDRDTGLSVNGEVPKWHNDPRVQGYSFKHCRATNTPGFWPGTEAQHGYLSFLTRSHLKSGRPGYDTDRSDALHHQAILHSFSWTLAQACYLGFGPYTELTYPITTQTIISDGQHFSFYAYQLNTCALYHKHSGDANPHRNVCFTTEESKLFDVIENGQLKGFNDDVLKTLIKFYLVKPTEPSVNMRPYLSPEMYIANVADVKRREQVEKNFKFIYSNRPYGKLADEIYHWEKIYKIDHKTRPMDAKRKFFETGAPSPGQRRLDDHMPAYIPKHLREEPKKSRRGRLPVTPTIKL